MKRIALLMMGIVMLTACDSGGEKKADQRLQVAQIALNNGDFSRAKLEIDSIKILYPTAFEARRRGLKLMLQVEYKEQLKTLAFLDSMMLIRQTELDSIKNNYIFEKDPDYQDVGNYFHPTQTLQKNINRSFLRGQVNELGIMYLTSIYCGTSAINHNAVKVLTSENLYAETPPSSDRYESLDLGVRTEKVDYKLGNDGNVIGFIVLNVDNKIKVEYLGGKKYILSMTPADRKAIAEIYALSQILSSMEEIRKEMKEANMKLEFVKRKLEED